MSPKDPTTDIRTYSRLHAPTIERLTLALVATAAVGRDVEAPRPSEGAKERDQIALLPAG